MWSEDKLQGREGVTGSGKIKISVGDFEFLSYHQMQAHRPMPPPTPPHGVRWAGAVKTKCSISKDSIPIHDAQEDIRTTRHLFFACEPPVVTHWGAPIHSPTLCRPILIHGAP